MAVAGDGEDDDPDPSDSRTDIFRVCVLADATLYQDTSAFSTYLGNQAGNTNLVEDILVGTSGAGSWLARMSTWRPGGLQTHFLVTVPAASSSSQDSSASSKYLGNQAGNIFMVEDFLMGAEWWWNRAWLGGYIEHGLWRWWLGMRDNSTGETESSMGGFGGEGGFGDGADRGEQGGELQAQPREHQTTGHQA